MPCKLDADHHVAVKNDSPSKAQPFARRPPRREQPHAVANGTQLAWEGGLECVAVKSLPLAAEGFSKLYTGAFLEEV